MAARLMAGVLAVLAGLLLAGCSSHEVDRDAWASDLKELGVTVNDWDRLEDTVRDLCDDDQDAMEMFLAVTKDDGGSMKEIETHIRNVCPDRVDMFEEALAQMGRTSGEVDQACETPESERTERQRVLADAMDC